jgi:two-component system sensor histidine kinase HydH
MGRMVKISSKLSSLIVAVLCAVLLSGLAVLAVWVIRDRSRLIRDNENERILFVLFAGLRDSDDIGEAILSNSMLKERITGVGIYDESLAGLYRWGKAPAAFDKNTLKKEQHDRSGRYAIADKHGGVTFVYSAVAQPEVAVMTWRKNLTEREGPEPPPSPPGQPEFWQLEPRQPELRSPELRQPDIRQAPVPQQQSERQRIIIARQGFPFLMGHNQAGAKYLEISVAHPAYWRTQTATFVLLPLFSAFFLALMLYIRHLYLRNHEYRERIESQKNLVVVGTAASTLAHEIKNPLLSIRIQTGILRKLFPKSGHEEVAIIDEEVERLSALIYRVNDYLREPAGNPVPVNAAAMLNETSLRLANRAIIEEASVKDIYAYIDSERLRSVLENIIRNALESGSPAPAIDASVSAEKGFVAIVISDRGKGVRNEALKAVFDPFFTSKSTGTGIGLSICKRFVEAVGGAITLENREDGPGARVRITLKSGNGQAANTI